MTKKRRLHFHSLKNNKQHGWIFPAVVTLAALVLVYGVISFMENKLFITSVHHDATLTLPEGDVYVELATKANAREKGLSGKTSIGDNEGMLFVFKYPGRYGFWMKDMKFPIDMVWIAEDGRVVNIEDEVDPSTFPKAFINGASAKYVLELKSGAARVEGLYLGTEIKLPETIKNLDAD